MHNKTQDAKKGSVQTPSAAKEGGGPDSPPPPVSRQEVFGAALWTSAARKGAEEDISPHSCTTSPPTDHNLICATPCNVVGQFKEEPGLELPSRAVEVAPPISEPKGAASKPNDAGLSRARGSVASIMRGLRKGKGKKSVLAESEVRLL